MTSIAISATHTMAVRRAIAVGVEQLEAEVEWRIADWVHEVDSSFVQQEPARAAIWCLARGSQDPRSRASDA
jgi:hypothetical protein